MEIIYAISVSFIFPNIWSVLYDLKSWNANISEHTGLYFTIIYEQLIDHFARRQNSVNCEITISVVQSKLNYYFFIISVNGQIHNCMLKCQ